VDAAVHLHIHRRPGVSAVLDLDGALLFPVVAQFRMVVRVDLQRHALGLMLDLHDGVVHDRVGLRFDGAQVPKRVLPHTPALVA
jgi:hypothetical protein